jgi:uncharacterized OsmC-like protein
VGEKVVVRQNSAYETLFWYADTDDQEHAELQPVMHLHELTPYGMMLASLGTCTTIVMHTYAQAHKLALDEVELRLTYERTYREDCRHCDEHQKPFEEAIGQEIVVVGKLSSGERKRLFRAAQLCPIHKIFHEGIAIGTQMADADAPLTPTGKDEEATKAAIPGNEQPAPAATPLAGPDQHEHHHHA